MSKRPSFKLFVGDEEGQVNFHGGEKMSFWAKESKNGAVYFSTKSQIELVIPAGRWIQLWPTFRANSVEDIDTSGPKKTKYGRFTDDDY